ncbi:PEP-CTERM sorting domain-containing protein [Rivibacter subsaxonicus]|uniref:Putative secreted protein with PEP-CTERM sorting signal n=1 Tax=Rivibacter subsaxonicus TaxID=457575 RepID=A0A4Q7VN94_9BURK|nr:PEP-CTERM sorting domain-containing protein [Rivibacter subsaxonicus]RZT97821.1 putative secreted protein with PEP-CTERM sorting signal [Rivibacter subsaxonicus]
MRYIKALLGGAALAAMLPTQAAIVVLDFEGVGDLASLDDFYNGGTDSAGNSGTNFGVIFTDTSIGYVDADAGGSGDQANEPTPNTVLTFEFSSNDIMNVPAGFDTGVSFFYSATEAVFIGVYDGLNATGNLLATIPLVKQFNIGCVGDPTGDTCNWSPAGAAFAGVAKSVDFSGAGLYVRFDNVTLGSARPVPEPSSYLLMALGLTAVGLVSRRRMRR